MPAATPETSATRFAPGDVRGQERGRGLVVVGAGTQHDVVGLDRRVRPVGPDVEVLADVVLGARRDQDALLGVEADRVADAGAADGDVRAAVDQDAHVVAQAAGAQRVLLDRVIAGLDDDGGAGEVLDRQALDDAVAGAGLEHEAVLGQARCRR